MKILVNLAKHKKTNFHTCPEVQAMFFLVSDLITLGVAFAFTAKFGISTSFAVIYILTAEVYPTVVRLVKERDLGEI